MYLRVHLRVCAGSPGGQKGLSALLELESPMIMCGTIGAGAQRGSSGRAASALSHGTVPPSRSPSFDKAPTDPREAALVLTPSTHSG